MMEYQIIQNYDYRKPKRKGWIIFFVIVGIIALLGFAEADAIKKSFANIPIFMNAQDRKNYETEQSYNRGEVVINNGISCTQLKIDASKLNYQGNPMQLQCESSCGKFNSNLESYQCNADKLTCICGK